MEEREFRRLVVGREWWLLRRRGTFYQRGRLLPERDCEEVEVEGRGLRSVDDGRATSSRAGKLNVEAQKVKAAPRQQGSADVGLRVEKQLEFRQPWNCQRVTGRMM